MPLCVSVARVLIFAFFLLRYSRLRSQTPRGRFPGLVLVGVFILRIPIEFLEERPAACAQNSPLRVGQRLRIRFVAFGTVRPSRLLPAGSER